MGLMLPVDLENDFFLLRSLVIELGALGGIMAGGTGCGRGKTGCSEQKATTNYQHFYHPSDLSFGSSAQYTIDEV